MKSKNKKIQIDTGDVAIRHYQPICACGNRAEFIVVVDFRSAGLMQRVDDPMCMRCARKFANRIRAGMPRKP